MRPSTSCRPSFMGPLGKNVDPDWPRPREMSIAKAPKIMARARDLRHSLGMTMVLRQIFNLLQLLGSETATRSIAAGFALGAILGFYGGLTLQALLVFVLALIFRVQLG